jgi:hypothetical protein
MEVVDKFWLARGYKSSDLLMLPFEMQLWAVSWSGVWKDSRMMGPRSFWPENLAAVSLFGNSTPVLKMDLVA